MNQENQILYLDTVGKHFITNLNDPTYRTIIDITDKNNPYWEITLCQPSGSSNQYITLGEYGGIVEVQIGSPDTLCAYGAMTFNGTSFVGNIIVNCPTASLYESNNTYFSVTYTGLSGKDCYYYNNILIHQNLAPGTITGSFFNLAVVSASYAGTASYLTGVIASASYALTSENVISSSYALSSSHAIKADTSSLADSSILFNGLVTGDFYRQGYHYNRGVLVYDYISQSFANVSQTLFDDGLGHIGIGVSASIANTLYISGSVRSADTIQTDNNLQIGNYSPTAMAQLNVLQDITKNGIAFETSPGKTLFCVNNSGSVTINTNAPARQCLDVSGSAVFVGSITASFAFTTASWSVTASNAITSSYALNAETASLALYTAYTSSILSSSYASGSTSASYAKSASHALVSDNSLMSNNSVEFGSHNPSYYTNASNLNGGYIPIARMQEDVIYQTTCSWATNVINSGSIESASYSDFARTASYAMNGGGSNISASHSLRSDLSDSSTYASTANYANSAGASSTAFASTSASYAIFATNANTSTSASFATIALNVLGSILNAISASYALSCSYYNQLWLVTGSLYPITASVAISASYYPPQTYQVNTTSASYASSSVTASYIKGSGVDGQVGNANYANSAGSAGSSNTCITAQTASYYNQLWLVTGSTYPITSSNAVTASFAFMAISASYSSYINVTQSQTFVLSASWASQSLSASYIKGSGVDGYVANATNATTAITAGTANAISFVPNLANTASYYNQLWLVTGSLYPITASRAISASNADLATTALACSGTASYAKDSLALQGYGPTTSNVANSVALRDLNGSLTVSTLNTTDQSFSGKVVSKVIVKDNVDGGFYVDANGKQVGDWIGKVTSSMSADACSGTASYATVALNVIGGTLSASHALVADSAVYAGTAGLASTANSALTAAYCSGTSSYANKAGTVSFADNATHATNADTSAACTGTANYANNSLALQGYWPIVTNTANSVALRDLHGSLTVSTLNTSANPIASGKLVLSVICKNTADGGFYTDATPKQIGDWIGKVTSSIGSDISTTALACSGTASFADHIPNVLATPGTKGDNLNTLSIIADAQGRITSWNTNIIGKISSAYNADTSSYISSANIIGTVASASSALYANSAGTAGSATNAANAASAQTAAYCNGTASYSTFAATAGTANSATIANNALACSGTSSYASNIPVVLASPGTKGDLLHTLSITANNQGRITDWIECPIGKIIACFNADTGSYAWNVQGYGPTTSNTANSLALRDAAGSLAVSALNGVTDMSFTSPKVITKIICKNNTDGGYYNDANAAQVAAFIGSNLIQSASHAVYADSAGGGGGGIAGTYRTIGMFGAAGTTMVDSIMIQRSNTGIGIGGSAGPSDVLYINGNTSIASSGYLQVLGDLHVYGKNYVGLTSYGIGTLAVPVHFSNGTNTLTIINGIITNIT